MGSDISVDFGYAICGILYLIALLVFLSWVFRSRSRYKELTHSCVFLVLLFLAITTALFSGPRVDYPGYLQQWQLVMDGLNPWVTNAGEMTSNAYGPAYNLLALFSHLHPLLPKCLFVFVWFGTIFWLDNHPILNKKLGPTERLILYLCLLMNPFFWNWFVISGHFDILVAACCLWAIHFQRVRRDFLCGIMLALGILLKFVPLVLFPFLCIENRRLRPKILLSCLTLLVSAFGLSYFLWGDAVFQPILFAGERASTRHSIFRFLRGQYSPLLLVTDAPNVDFMSLPLMAIFSVSLFLLHLKKNFEITTVCLLMVIGILLLYRVGHSQFQVIPIFIGSYWFVLHSHGNMDKHGLGLLALLYLSWISILAPAYQIAVGFQFAVETVGLISFSIGVLFWILFLKTALSETRP